MSIEDEFIENLIEVLMDDTEENNNELIETINKPKFKVNKQIEYNDNNQFPLFICARYFVNNEILQTLLDKGANINAIDDDSNNILGYLITTMIEEEGDEAEFIRTFEFLVDNGANIYYINSVTNSSVFELIEKLSEYYSSKKMKLFIKFRNNNYLYLLNSFFSKIGLIFKFDKIIHNCLYFVINPEICGTSYGLKLSINKKTKNLCIMLLSNCKNIRGTTILSLMKKFACKINSNEIFLHDQQSLVLEHDKVIQNIAILDIAVNGESWYNKMGFYKKDANPEEDKRINIEKSQTLLSSALEKIVQDNYIHYIEDFKEAFKDDSNIDVNDSIKNIFTIIKRDYLKNKTKKITINQCYIISSILIILTHYYKYDSELYYNNSGCSKSLKLKSSSTRRRTFDSWKPKSRKIYHSY
jgi:ankyrin repeat protein